MRAQQLPARAGWHWLIAGLAILRGNPPMLVLVIAAYWLILLFLNLLPVVGAIVASIAIPGLSVGVMNACREIDQGRPVTAAVIFTGFRENVRSLVILGILYLVLTMGVLAVSIPADGGELFTYLTTGKRSDGNADDALLAALLVLLSLLPLVMAYWFAPMLAAWHRLSPLKALFFSLVAVWINWRAFFVYALALAGIGGLLPLFLLTAVGLLAPGALGMVSAVLTVPLFMFLMPVIFASFYASYRDVFHLSEHV